MRSRHRLGFTLTELTFTSAAVLCLVALAVPVLGRVGGNAGVQTSMSNLTTLGIAHALYALDWNGRQVTWAVDELATYGSVGGYNSAHGGCFSTFDPGCHPGVVWGWAQDSNLYGYWMSLSGHHWAAEPIHFDGSVSHFGHFRFPNVNPFHDYVGGRIYDPVFWAPNDTVLFEEASTLFDDPSEYNMLINPPVWASYCMSPAAMFSPGVMRANADGGWQDPWDIPEGFTSPGLFQAAHPSLKTLMIEHSWAQDPPSECNPNFFECEPWYFNHGLESEPVALFYDGQVRLLPNAEVLAGDQQILEQTNGEDGLWHRGTPFGDDGYLISAGFDGVPLSHHVLTTDGILGRDTLGAIPGKPLAAPGMRSWRTKLSWRRLMAPGDNLDTLVIGVDP
jgi:hypothetical protein